MKKILLTMLLTFVARISFAQLTLEHTFPLGINVVKINATDYRYVYVDTGKSEVFIYNTDYTLEKNFTFQRPAGSTFSGSRLVSKNLFATNNQYQIGVSLITTNPSYSDNYYIFNEDGSLFWKGPHNYGTASFYNFSNGTKMIMSPDDVDSILVYSLAGHYYSSIEPIGGDSIGTQVYPNPSSDHLIIPIVKLKMATDVVISNMQGKIVQQVTVNPGQNSVSIDTHMFPDGVYVYFIGPQGNPSGETGKFIVSH